MVAVEVLMIVLGGLALIVCAAMWNGYLLSIFWGWFIVPFGLPAIGVAHAMGLALIVGLLRGMPKHDDDQKPWTRLLAWFLGSLILLGVGYVLKGYVHQ